MKTFLVKQENGYLTRVHCYSEEQFERWATAQQWDPAIQEIRLCTDDIPADCAITLGRWD